MELSFVVHTVVYCAALASADYRPKTYDIDLDVRPGLRWRNVTADHLKYREDVRSMTRQWVPEFLQPTVWRLGKWIGSCLPDEYREEINGIAKQSGVPFGELVMLNMIYDLTAFNRDYRGRSSASPFACTSIVACDAAGTVYHGRNLDYAMEGVLKHLTVLVRFHKGGKHLYDAVVFAYTVGVLTGQRPGEYSASLNERNSGTILDNLLMAMLTEFANPVTLALRDVLATQADHAAAVRRLSAERLMAPCYWTLADGRGPYGAVITRDRVSYTDIWRLNGSSNASEWYLVETNYDHWLPAPSSDTRRLVAMDAMDTMGRQRLTDKAMYDAMSVRPVLNR